MKSQYLPLALWLSVVACSTGQIEDAEGFGLGPAASGEDPSLPPQVLVPGPGGGAVVDPGVSGAAAALTLPNARMRKLTLEQYRNSVSDVLGAGIVVPSDLEPDTAQNGFYAVAASNATISPAAAEKLERSAYDVAAQALAPAHRASLVPCQPTGVSDAACARAFVTSVGRRAFRRPLTELELTRYTTIASTSATTLGDFHAGLEFALAGLLQSPQFLFRSELGEVDPTDAKRLRFTHYELAARISYALWNTTPDDALLAAAESGKLEDTGLTVEVQRLLADPRAKSALDNFHVERLGLAELASLDKAASVIDSVSDDLRGALRDDVLRTFAEFTGPQAQDFMGTFDSRVVFVNAPLANIYGLAVKPSTLTRAELPATGPRLGLLGKPAFLALNAHGSETSPTLRGRYVRERFLCQAIPAPPPNVVPVLGEPDPNAPTMRERLAVHASDKGCATCHNMMDPLGLALEHFDPIGRYRDTDQGHVLDTTGNLDGTDFDGAVELAGLLRSDPRTAECLVRQAYRYALGHVETTAEEPQIAALAQQFNASGHKLDGLFQALVSSPAFRYAAKETP